MSEATGIVLTDGASEKVAALLAQEDRNDLYLRVAVQPGGCSGLRYQLFFDDRQMDGDVEKKFGEVVSREWRRHNLVVLSDNEPTLIIEGKSWIHYDAVSPTKLAKGSKSIREEMEKDISKIRATQKKYPNAHGLISTLLFTIDGTSYNSREFNKFHVKYGPYHNQGIKKLGSAEELAGKGRSKLRELLENRGTLKRRPIKVGKYFGMQVEVDLHLLAI